MRRYLKYMANVDEVTRQLAQVKEQCNTQLDEMRIKRAEKQDQVNKEWETLLARKREIAKTAVFGRSGKALTNKEIDALEEQERKKETEVCQVRRKFMSSKIYSVKNYFIENLFYESSLGSSGKYSAKTSAEEARIGVEAERRTRRRAPPHRL